MNYGGRGEKNAWDFDVNYVAWESSGKYDC